MSSEKRRFTRVELSLPVRYKVYHPDRLEIEVADAALPKAAQLQNLSAGGLRLVTGEQLENGQVLELFFELPKHGATRTVAKIVWCESLPEEKGFAAGIQFIPVYPEDLRNVRSYFGLPQED